MSLADAVLSDLDKVKGVLSLVATKLGFNSEETATALKADIDAIGDDIKAAVEQGFTGGASTTTGAAAVTAAAPVLTPQEVYLSSLPTADPGIEGQPFNNNGVLTISGGPTTDAAAWD